MIILSGVAGAGKSIQGRLFADELGYAWISTGELFRAVVTGERRRRMLKGELLDDQEVIELLDKTLGLLDLSKELVIEGFPRTQFQAEWLIKQVSDGRLNITAIFNLVASKEVVLNRLLSRGRLDDKEEVIATRFEEYERKTMPIIDYFKSKGIKVYDINADLTPSEVHQQMVKRIGLETKNANPS